MYLFLLPKLQRTLLRKYIWNSFTLKKKVKKIKALCHCCVSFHLSYIFVFTSSRFIGLKLQTDQQHAWDAITMKLYTHNYFKRNSRFNSSNASLIMIWCDVGIVFDSDFYYSFLTIIYLIFGVLLFKATWLVKFLQYVENLAMFLMSTIYWFHRTFEASIIPMFLFISYGFIPQSRFCFTTEQLTAAHYI